MVGPYMLLEFVDLPLETAESAEVDITCVEAQEENLYVGTSAHEILHFVLLPPTEPGTPIAATLDPPEFPTQKPSYILASRIQPPLTSGATPHSREPYIKNILLLPGPGKILVLSSTGLLSFWSYPELSPAYGGSVKVASTNFIGALDLNDLGIDEVEADSYASTTGSVGKKLGRPRVENSKMVMVITKKTVKMVRVKEEESRLVKNIECPCIVNGVRRGLVACVATNTDYTLLHLEMKGIIPLFPILSSNSSPPADISKSTEEQGLTEEVPPLPARSTSKPQPSQPPSASEASDTDGSTRRKVAVKRSSPSPSQPHPLRSSSLQQRPRSEILAEDTRSKLSITEDSVGKHARSSSTGSIQRRPSSSIGRNSPLSRSMGRTSGKDLTQDIVVGRPETTSPTPPIGAATRVKSPIAAPSLSRSTRLTIPTQTGSRDNTPNRSPPGSATSSQVTVPQRGKSPPQITQPAPGILKPHIVSPTQSEFLLITGTSPSDPGVGMFVNDSGDPTRGTIQLSKYPEEVVLDGRYLIALHPVSEGVQGVRLLEMICIQESDIDPSSTSFIEVMTSSMTGNAGITKVMGLQDVVGSDVGRLLRISRVYLLTGKNTSNPKTGDPQEWEVKRNEEELEAAIRISKLGGRVVLFNGKRMWRLLPNPMVTQLDSRLPRLIMPLSSESTTEAKQEAEKRRSTILSVLKDVHDLEPSTERMFHEIAYLKQKCGVLLLAEFLSLSREEDKTQFPTELLATERALIEGSLDPRIVVSLFSGFEDELREGKYGVWVYCGVKEVVNIVLKEREGQEHLKGGEDETKEPQWNGRRDLLLLLRRYLSAWRQKKGFGSVSQLDEKEVFWTIDAALMRCLLLLESTRSPSALQHMAGEADVRQELYDMCDYPSSVECFDRCVYLLQRFKRLYVLSILYQSKKMSREVLETWKKLFESGDERVMAEFGDGEDKVADYLLSKKDRELVKEYGLWLANRNSRLGVKVFADERARVKWEVQEVLDMLSEHAPDALRIYLEHLVIERKNYTYSNDLLLIYLNSITSTLSSPSTTATALQSSYEAYRALSLPKPTYRKFLEENVVSATIMGDGADWWNQRLRFLDLLASVSELESTYDNTAIMEKLEPFKELLVAEMIVLYGRAGNHGEALHLLVHELRDFDGSVEYCLDVGKPRSTLRRKSKRANDKTPNESTNSSITRKDQEKLFASLLVEALRLGDWMIRQEWVEVLLGRWGTWLDPVHVLSVIPDTYSITLISEYLISTLRNLVREKNESAIVRAIRRGENLRVNADFVDLCDEHGPTVQTMEGPTSF